MGYFRKKSKGVEHPLQHKLAGGIADFIRRAQLGWVGFMQRRFGRLDRRIRVVIFIGYMVAMCLVSGNSILESMSYKPETFDLPTPTTVPIIQQQKTRDAIYDSRADPLAGRLARYRHHLDSLGKSDAGKQQLDSLRRFRPGLLDSLEQVQELYR